MTTSNCNLLHILFANFHGDPHNAPALAELLLAHKVDPNLLDKNGKTPLHSALKQEQLSAIGFASTHSCFDFNRKGSSGRTPLHYSLKKSNLA